MNCEDIIIKYLIDNKYDGLYIPGGCGCKLDDLMPCCENFADCKPGYITYCKDCNNDNCDMRDDYCIGGKK
jgi:hypothetical protein